MNAMVNYLRHACLGLAALTLVSCNVKNGEGEACDSYVNFVYDYNMSYVDLFYKQASKMRLYLFDENGVFLDVITDQVPAGQTFPSGYRIKLPAGLQRATQFVAWSGLNDDHCTSVNLVKGVSTMADMCVHLNPCQDNTVSHAFEHLWHGNIVNGTRAITYTNETNTVSMMKNTNTIRMVLHAKDENGVIYPLDANDINVSFSAINGSYAYTNQVDNDDLWTYKPNFLLSDAETGAAVAELMTMRLLAENRDGSKADNRLKITYIPTGQVILDINMTTYLGLLKLAEHRNIATLQEYMDRESDYKMLVFFNVDNGSGQPVFLSAKMEINDWTYRWNEVNE